MNGVVLDTSVVSFMFGGDSRAEYYTAQIAGRRSFVSFQTLEEMWFGARAKNWGARRKNDLARHLDQHEVVWPTEELVDICAQLRSARQSAGRRLQPRPGAAVRAVFAVACGSGRSGEVSPFAGQVVVAEPGCEVCSGAVVEREQRGDECVGLVGDGVELDAVLDGWTAGLTPPKRCRW